MEKEQAHAVALRALGVLATVGALAAILWHTGFLTNPYGWIALILTAAWGAFTVVGLARNVS